MNRVNRDKRNGTPLFHPFSRTLLSAGKALKKKMEMEARPPRLDGQAGKQPGRQGFSG